MDTSQAQKPVFSNITITWMLSILVGIVLPLFTQTLVADQLSKLSILPASTSNLETADANAQLIAALTVLGLFIVYVSVIAFQIYFIAKTIKISSVVALIVTLISPITIWLVIPYLISAVS